MGAKTVGISCKISYCSKRQKMDEMVPHKRETYLGLKTKTSSLIMTSTRGTRGVLPTRIRFAGFMIGCYTDGNIVALCTRWCEVDSNLTICSSMVCMGGCCTHCTGKMGFCTIRDGQVVRAERLLDGMRGATTIS